MARHRATRTRPPFLGRRPKQSAETASTSPQQPELPAHNPEKANRPIPVETTHVWLMYPDGKRHRLDVVDGLLIGVAPSLRFLVSMPDRRRIGKLGGPTPATVG